MTILASTTIGSYSNFNKSLRLFEEVRDADGAVHEGDHAEVRGGAHDPADRRHPAEGGEDGRDN